MLAVISGKGGVGKSMLTAALGAQLARRGQRVVLVDMNTGLRCLDMLFGLESRVGFDIGDVLTGGCGLDRALVTDRRTGLRLLAARQFGEGTLLNERALGIVLEVLSLQSDYVLLDAPSGMTEGFEQVLRMVQETILVSTPDDVSLRDAERLASRLLESHKPSPMLVINGVRGEDVDAGLQYTPQVCAQLLDISLLGVIPWDDEAWRTALAKDPTLGETEAAQAVANIADRLLDPAIPVRPWREEPEETVAEVEPEEIVQILEIVEPEPIQSPPETSSPPPQPERRRLLDRLRRSQ